MMVAPSSPTRKTKKRSLIPRSHSLLNPPSGVRTEGAEAGLDARKACIEERSVVGYYVSTTEVRLTTQTGPPTHTRCGWASKYRRPNTTVGGGFRSLPGGFPTRPK